MRKSIFVLGFIFYYRAIRKIIESNSIKRNSIIYNHIIIRFKSIFINTIFIEIFHFSYLITEGSSQHRSSESHNADILAQACPIFLHHPSFVRNLLCTSENQT
ncbi:Uncharacterised protein [Delftia tsuruhatensis]|nr:Uncharacterised protein [Delftia tsuruhatensis]